MKVTLNDLRQSLMQNPRATSGELCRLLKSVNRSTLMRLVAQMDNEVIRRGGSRRTRYALRRALRGRSKSLPLYRIDAAGAGHTVARLDLTRASALGMNISNWDITTEIVVYIHRLIPSTCKLAGNPVYSCLLGERNAFDEWSISGGLPEQN